MKLLEAINLSKRFSGLMAIEDLSFNVNQGEILGLIGPNGSGKTTTFNLITGFLRPTAGKILFEGKNICGCKPNQIAKIGIVRSWQQTALFGDMTTLDNITMGHYLQTKSGFFRSIFNTASARQEAAEIKQFAMEIAQYMGLDSCCNEYARNLPHGHQRALGVSMALAAKPKLLLLDEPLTGLNIVETETMVNRLSKIRDKGIALLMVEHNMKAVLDFCDRIVVLSFGKKIAEGSPEDIKTNNDVIEAYLGTAMRSENAA